MLEPSKKQRRHPIHKKKAENANEDTCKVKEEEEESDGEDIKDIVDVDAMEKKIWIDDNEGKKEKEKKKKSKKKVKKDSDGASPPKKKKSRKSTEVSKEEDVEKKKQFANAFNSFVKTMEEGGPKMFLPTVPLPRVDIEKELLRSNLQLPEATVLLPQIPEAPPVSLSDSARQRWVSSFAGVRVESKPQAKPKNCQAVSLSAAPGEAGQQHHPLLQGAAATSRQELASYCSQANLATSAAPLLQHHQVAPPTCQTQLQQRQSQAAIPSSYNVANGYQFQQGHYQPPPPPPHTTLALHHRPQQVLLPSEPLPHYALTSTQPSWPQAQVPQQPPIYILEGPPVWSTPGIPTSAPLPQNVQQRMATTTVNHVHPTQTHQGMTSWNGQRHGDPGQGSHYHQGPPSSLVVAPSPQQQQQQSGQQPQQQLAARRDSGDTRISTSLMVLGPTWRPPMPTCVPPSPSLPGDWRAEGSVNLSTETMKIRVLAPPSLNRKFILPFQNIFSARLGNNPSSSRSVLEQVSRGPADYSDWKVDVALYLDRGDGNGQLLKASVVDPWKRPYLVSIPLQAPKTA